MQTNEGIRMSNKDHIRECGVCITLLIANCIFSLAGFLSDSFFESFALVPAFVKDGEYYRLVTSMFLHGDITHLMSNMIGLYCIGQILEMGTGHIRMAVIYFITGISGGLLVVFTSGLELPSIELGRISLGLSCGIYDMTIGASGAIFGMMAAALICMKRRNDAFRVRGLLINLALNLYATFTVPGISIEGHIGGLIMGLILGAVMTGPGHLHPKTPGEPKEEEEGQIIYLNERR